MDDANRLRELRATPRNLRVDANAFPGASYRPAMTTAASSPLRIDADNNIRLSDATLWAGFAAAWEPRADGVRVLAHARVGGGAVAEESDEHHWAAWAPASRAAFIAACDAADDRFRAAGSLLCLLPRAADALSDVPGVLTFLRQRAASSLRIVLDPVLLLTPSMLGHAEDHLARAILSIGAMPGVAAIIVRNLSRDAEFLVPCRFGEGVLDQRWILGPLAELKKSGAAMPPLVVCAGDEAAVADLA